MIKFMNFMNQWEFMHVWMKFPKIRSYMHEFPFVHKIHKFDHGDDLVIMAMTGCWSCMKISFMAVFMTSNCDTYSARIGTILLLWRSTVLFRRYRELAKRSPLCGKKRKCPCWSTAGGTSSFSTADCHLSTKGDGLSRGERKRWALQLHEKKWLPW